MYVMPLWSKHKDLICMFEKGIENCGLGIDSRKAFAYTLNNSSGIIDGSVCKFLFFNISRLSAGFNRVGVRKKVEQPSTESINFMSVKCREHICVRCRYSFAIWSALKLGLPAMFE